MEQMGKKMRYYTCRPMCKPVILSAEPVGVISSYNFASYGVVHFILYHFITNKIIKLM